MLFRSHGSSRCAPCLLGRVSPQPLHLHLARTQGDPRLTARPVFLPHLFPTLSTSPRPPQIPRKVLHSSIAFLVTAIWLRHPSVPQTIHAAAAGLAVVVLADVLRFRYPAVEVVVRPPSALLELFRAGS